MKKDAVVLGMGVVAIATLAFAVGRGMEREASAYGGDGSCTIGEIGVFAGNFTPKNWAPADGRLMPIQQNTAVFSILGTTYGGDGKTNFALPDLRGRVIMGAGQGTNLTNRPLGESTGAESVTPATVAVAAPQHGAPVSVVHPGPIPIVPPHLALTPMICVTGTFPARP